MSWSIKADLGSAAATDFPLGVGHLPHRREPCYNPSL